MSKGAKQERSEEQSPPSAVMERLNWQLAWRDDGRVAQALYAGEEIEEMHDTPRGGVAGRIVCVPRGDRHDGGGGTGGVARSTTGAGTNRAVCVAVSASSVLFGGQSMNELPRVLFSNVALMELVGFNARQVADGLTKRGDAQRKTRKKQGPLSPQSLADNISKLSQEQMERLFNEMVKLVVSLGLLDGERIAALDGSKLPTPPTYEGCGKLKQTRKVKVKGQKERAIEEYYVYGWKVLVLIDVRTRLPLAMKVVKIQEYEGRWLVPLLEQAQRNLGTRGHISTIVIDRGYLDGEDLWLVDQQGVIFVIVSKANMTVTQDAQALAKGERAQVRERVVRHGHGKTATQERLCTELGGIGGLTTYDSYGDADQTKLAHW